MPDKNTKKSTGENLAVLEQESKGFSGRLNQERAYKILSQGIVLTMEDDLREALSRQKMKADLIPGQSKKEDKTQEVFAETPVFDPFQNLEEAVEEAPEKAKPDRLPDQASFVKKIEPEASQKPESFASNVAVELPEKTEEKQEEAYKEAQKPVILKEIIGENIEKNKQNLGQKILDILSKLKNINTEEEPLLQRRNVILEKIALQKKALESFFQKTETIRLGQVKLEKQEQEAKDSLIKHSFEEQRWQIEEKLKQAQDLQWTQEEEIEKAQMALSKVDNDLKSFSEQKAKLEKEKIEIQKFLENIGFLKQKEEFLNKNQSFLNQKSQLEASYNEALLQKNKQDQELLLITQEEQKIEKDLKILENKTQQAVDSQERRKIEQERRELTQKRQLQEKKRWEFEKNQMAVKNNFNLANEKFLKIKQEEENFNQKVAEIEARIDKGIFLPEAEKYLKPLIQSKEPEKVSLQEPQQEGQEIKKETQREAVLPVAVSQPITSNKTVFKETLLSREQEQEAVEKIRLGAKEREQELIQKQVVQKQVIEGKQAIHAELKQKQEEENRAKAIIKLRQIAEQEQKKSFAGKLKGPLLKEEILRKLTKISLAEEGQRKEFLARINKKTKLLPKQKQKGFEEAVIFHPMIRKISLFEKIAIRFLIVLIIIGAGVGIYFGALELNKKQGNNIPSVDNNSTTSLNPTDDWPSLYPNGSTTASSTIPLATSTIPLATTTASSTIPLATSTLPQTTTTPVVIAPPISLIPVSKNNILSYDGDFTVLTSSTATIINKRISYNAFEQISVLNNNENSFFAAPQFFEVLGASLPEEVFNGSGTSTVLVYSSKYGNRLGFVLATVSTSSLLTAFRSWESQAEASTVSIFNLMGKKSPAISKVFKNVIYKAVSIRCQAFAVTDFGICYAVYKNYFIWTSAYEQMQRIVDKLL